MSASKTPFCFKDIFLILTFVSFLVALNYHRTTPILHHLASFSSVIVTAAAATTTKKSPNTTNHLLFSIASSSKTFSKRKEFLRLWYKPNFMKSYVFLDHPLSKNYNYLENIDLPPILIYDDRSRFPNTHSAGARYALGLAYMIKQVVALNDPNVRWYIFGDDDTVFLVDNLVNTLEKYDHNEWYYIGSNSESYVQNNYFSFDMAFGGGGYAISRPLAMVLARVLDSCLMRYPSLYSSDARIFSCLAELGVSLTHVPGFHQDDIWGNLFGLLSSHPLSLLLSLHHIEGVQSIFPNMTKIQALKHKLLTLILQEYHNKLFAMVEKIHYPLQWLGVTRTKVESKGPCKKMVAFLRSVVSNGDKVWSNYMRHRVMGKTCTKYDNKVLKNLEEIRVFSSKLEIDTRQVRAPRRQYCDISLSSKKSMDIQIRPCGIDELITMSP
ncbi:hypothetical protein HAX54_010943 [Datura stramonium]|uniref:Uncharacterized protein n=1 Tax=Datura stramonium TaxID=4076 RepID=A0ABS8RX31_DATST|nr:hypothetical protein [Datura stramonium]